jgi:hypothetical protein
VRTHVEILIRLKLNESENLHTVLRQFSCRAEGWDFPEAKSKGYQQLHGSAAGFIVSENIKGLQRAAVAVAQKKKRACTFYVPNIVPRDTSHLSLRQYNDIGQRFAADFRNFLREQKHQGVLETIGPEIGLNEIITAPRCKELFTAWLRSPTPTSHPSDVRLLDQFICLAFRHRARINLYDLEQHLTQDLKWPSVSVTWAIRRIQAGFDILQVRHE